MVAKKLRQFVQRIVKEDAKAIKQMQELWADARRNKKIYESSLLKYIDQTAELLEASQQLNFKRWNIMGSYVHQNPKVWGSYEKEVENVKNYVKARLKKMDKWLKFDATSIESVSDESLSSDLVTVYNLQGAIVSECHIDEITSLPKGTYVIMYSNGETQKIIL